MAEWRPMRSMEKNSKFVNVNGQLVCASPPINWKGPPPPKECDVYIGNLPKDMLAEELFDYCEAFGSMYKFRFLIDAIGNSKGHAYVTYATEDMAGKAAASINNLEVRPSIKITARKRVDSPKLCSTCKVGFSEWKYSTNIIKKNYPFVQVYGVRQYGPPSDWKGAEPPKNSQLFIGNIPTDVFENELLSLLESVGPIFEFRFMITKTGHTRGYAFCTYANPEDAVKAIRSFHEFEIRLSTKIRVEKVMSNNAIWIGFFPGDKTNEDIYIELREHVTGITTITPYTIHEKNLLAVKVNFENHQQASRAKCFLQFGHARLFDKIPDAVGWAKGDPNDRPLVEVTKVDGQVHNMFRGNVTNFQK
ncbi:APOBEC1 complementation factor [Caerostris darwini]|uniref:APOBEC1 complementation factor n=1 Tax=Caerostris darwini TaxID=1538125 RepID=A0AAV4MLE1_9ARAC|nr:APOBEC1 complementation factor [Caerostris darwini]